MKSSTCLINGLIVSCLVLLLGGVGFLVGNFAIGEYNPPWTHYSIQSPPKEIVEISYVEIESNLEDPTGDTVFVKDKNGEVYSNVLFQSGWSKVNPVPAWDKESPYECTGEWLVPSDSHIWDKPPVDHVIASYGLLFDRPLSTIIRCYLLEEDGNMEVWVHSGNAMDLLVGIALKTLSVIIGAVIGIIISVKIIRKRAVSHTV